MTPERDNTKEKHDHLKSEFGKLHANLEQILFKHDPMGIAFVDDQNVPENPDEYAQEAGTILPRLQTAKSADDVKDIVCGEFVRWFGDEAPTGANANYEDLSNEIWLVWERSNKTRSE